MKALSTLRIDRVGHVAELVLNRPQKLNAMNPAFFEEFESALQQLKADAEVRVVHIRGEGRAFTAGLDLKETSLQPSGGTTTTHAESAAEFLRLVTAYQKPFVTLTQMLKPVLASIHGHCIGGGMDLSAACDVRVACKNAVFSVREIRIGMVADIGTLAHVERVMNASAAREMAYTGADYSAAQMKEWGFISRIYDTPEETLAESRKLAAAMAANSSLVLSGVKNTLNYARDHTVEESMKQVAVWNAAFIQSQDLVEAMSAFFEKRQPVYRSKL